MSSLVRFSAAWLAFMAMLLGSAANAADLYWSGTGTWDTTTANWGNAPGTYTGSTWSNDPPDSAIFEGAAGTVALGAAITAAGLTFSTTDYTVTSGTLTLAGTPSISAGTGISATIESVIAGGDAITKTGSGTLTLSGGNTFTNNTIVSAGTVRIGNSSAFGPQGIAAPVTQVVVESGGTVDFNGVIDAGYGYTIAGAGDGAGALVNNGTAIGNTIRQAINVLLSADATIGGTGNWSLLAGGYGPTSLDLAGHTLTKAGANTIGLLNSTLTAGSINVSEGRLDVLSNTTSAAGVAVSLDDVASAELRVNNGGTLTIGSLAGGGTTGGGVNLANGSLNVGSLGTDTTFSGVISGSGRLIKTGSGTLTLSGGNTFTNNTIISAGTVRIGNSSAFGPQGAAPVTQVVVESGGTVDFNGVIDAGYGYTIAGAGDGAGALVNNGAAIGNTIRQAINVLLSADATIGGTGNWSLLAGGYGPTSLDLAGHTLTKAGANTIGLLNSTLTAGSINVSEGRLDVLSNTTSAAGVAVSLDDVASAELRVNNGGTLTIGSLAGGGTTGGGVNLANGSLNVGSLGTDTTFSGVISGGGPLIKSGSGTLTLNGVSNYSGGTTINAGTLLAGNADALGTSGAISVGASGTLGIGDGVTFTRPFSLTAGGRVRTGDNSTVGLPSVAALAGWESQSSTGDQTLAEILDASGSTTPTALTSAWTANPGGYFSDILTLEGTGADNTFVLSMEYSAASDGLNIWYRADELGAFAPLGTSFVGNVPWDNSFTTVGQYGVDTSAGTVWAVTDHNSQFAVVPEPGTLGLSAMCLAGGLWYLRQRRA